MYDIKESGARIKELRLKKGVAQDKWQMIWGSLWKQQAELKGS